MLPPFHPHHHSMSNRKGHLAIGGEVEPEVGLGEGLADVHEVLAQELGEDGAASYE